jgi:hypothetical protein
MYIIAFSLLILATNFLKMHKYIYLTLIGLGLSLSANAQEDTTGSDDDFDFSEFEFASEPAKAYCNNKVLGQSPTSLIGIFYNQQLPHDLVAGSPDLTNPSLADSIRITGAQQISIVGNFPLVSRNNILINLGVTYEQQHYSVDEINSHPFGNQLNDNVLRRTNLTFTLFKPLSKTNFILAQLQSELNGDYDLSSIDFGKTRFPLAILYGWKPSDRLMYAFGLSRTYLGGALNYVPIIYYYHTFKNQKWGMEALLPARAMLRYRFSSLSYMGLGFNVNGASFSMGNFKNDFNMNTVGLPATDFELRRSEIRAGLSYSRQLSGFFWMSVEAGYRINYSYNVDQGGDFTRLFGSEEPYFFENDLANTAYFTVGLSYVSP